MRLCYHEHPCYLLFHVPTRTRIVHLCITVRTASYILGAFVHISVPTASLRASKFPLIAYDVVRSCVQ